MTMFTDRIWNIRTQPERLSKWAVCRPYWIEQIPGHSRELSDDDIRANLPPELATACLNAIYGSTCET